MNARRDSLRAGLLVLFAAAAPWDAFLFLPGLRIRLTWLLALAILALEIADYAPVSYTHLTLPTIYSV